MNEANLKACTMLFEMLLRSHLSKHYEQDVKSVEICELYDNDWNVHVIMADGTRHNLWPSEIDKILNGD